VSEEHYIRFDVMSGFSQPFLNWFGDWRPPPEISNFLPGTDADRQHNARTVGGTEVEDSSSTKNGRLT
jgi:hypothetical protein